MKTTLDIVRELHEIFNHPIKDKPDFKDLGLITLRIKLIDEEFYKELIPALQAASENPSIQNIADVFDALLDLQVVLDGTFLALGLWKIKDEGFDEVHRSNMSKLDVKGKPIYRADGKFLKGPNYSPPNLYPIIKRLLNEE